MGMELFMMKLDENALKNKKKKEYERLMDLEEVFYKLLVKMKDGV